MGNENRIAPINPKRICYVCGFNFDMEPLEDQQDWPFIFCPCCCFEFGFQDIGNDDSYVLNRTEWINNGLEFGFRLYPEDYEWTLDIAIAQLNNLKLVDIHESPGAEEYNPNYTTEVDIEFVKQQWHKFRDG